LGPPFEDLFAIHLSDLGGANAALEGEKATVRRAACFAVELAQGASRDFNPSLPKSVVDRNPKRSSRRTANPSAVTQNSVM
jgi:hypothetical protein